MNGSFQNTLLIFVLILFTPQILQGFFSKVCKNGALIKRKVLAQPKSTAFITAGMGAAYTLSFYFVYTQQQEFKKLQSLLAKQTQIKHKNNLKLSKNN